LQDPPKFTQILIFWFENRPSGNPGRMQVLTFMENGCLQVATLMIGFFLFLGERSLCANYLDPGCTL
jgi:hypothetical protein